jgi:hypothetical protein
LKFLKTIYILTLLNRNLQLIVNFENIFLKVWYRSFDNTATLLKLYQSNLRLLWYAWSLETGDTMDAGLSWESFVNCLLFIFDWYNFSSVAVLSKDLYQTFKKIFSLRWIEKNEKQKIPTCPNSFIIEMRLYTSGLSVIYVYMDTRSWFRNLWMPLMAQ